MKKYKVKNEEEFYSLEVEIVLSEVSANNFLILEIKNKKYGIAWNGIGEAKIEQFIEYDLLVIGAGERIVAISMETGIVKLSLGLGFPFYFFEKMEYGFFIVSELTIIGINELDCSINRFIVASDIIQDVKVEGDKFIIQCLSSTFTA